MPETGSTRRVNYGQLFKIIEAVAEAMGAAIEKTGTGELVVYTGVAENRDGELVQWCDECESGDELPDDGCHICGRGVTEPDTRPRCQDCGEPCELADPADPELGYCHAEDANDDAKHTARVQATGPQSGDG